MIVYWNGINYQGYYDLNELYEHGYGKMTYQNGNIYEGNWDKGKRVGLGKFTDLINKCEYDGNWFDDKANGEGKYRRETNNSLSDTNKTISVEYLGNWENGLKSGFGKQTVKHHYYTEIYEGYWKNNKYHGPGILKISFINSNNPVIYEGTWINGNKKGIFRYTINESEKITNYH